MSAHRSAVVGPALGCSPIKRHASWAQNVTKSGPWAQDRELPQYERPGWIVDTGRFAAMPGKVARKG